MEKYIHYCWFGNKPLPKLAKKCIKSWGKYLPDYKIMRWSEDNVDLNECPFIKEAYEKKKWAFVADYARTRALYEYGGIYFDTDMLIVNPIDYLLEKKGTILGVEDSNMVNAAVWVESSPKSWFSKKMLDFYSEQLGFNEADIYSISIPRIITKILNRIGFNPHISDVQLLKNDIHIYPREYFYPLSYNYRNNVFTENTCMIHYFDASWVSKWEQRENRIFRRFGEKNGQTIINLIRFSKKWIKRALKLVFFPIYLYRRYKRKITKKYLKTVNKAIECIDISNRKYIVMHNPEWFGVTNATIELFDNRVPCGELLRKRDIRLIGNKILKNNIQQVIFSAMCIGWKDLAEYLKSRNPNIKIKVFWHGNHSQVSEPYGWKRNIELLEMQKKGTIDVFGTCKKSLIDFYEKEGYRIAFITNRVKIQKKLKIKKNNGSNIIRIGLYAAKSDDWRKNMFAQIAAVALMDNVVLDIVPLNNEAKLFASYFNLKIEGLEKAIPREELITRMSNNDVNLYVTFSECSPMLPLESFGVGVPCITGNNHHYWIDSELQKYAVINNEEDILEIRDKIELALKNKDKMLNLYRVFKDKNNIKSKEDVINFINM